MTQMYHFFNLLTCCYLAPSAGGCRWTLQNACWRVLLRREIDFRWRQHPGPVRRKRCCLKMIESHNATNPIYSLHGRCSFWRHGSFPQSAKETWYAHIAEDLLLIGIESTRQAMSNIVKVILDCGILASWLYDGWLMMCTPGGDAMPLFLVGTLRLMIITIGT